MLLRLATRGMNPYFQSVEEMADELDTSLCPHLPAGPLEAVWFYGAGCTPEKAPAVRRVLASRLAVDGGVEVHSDLLAAARALCGHRPGIACILGTGSNSCFYDGAQIAAHVPPLGFILGDEGSGAVLGRLLVGDLLKGRLPAALQEEFLTAYALTPAEVIDRVYRRPFPNRFLASLSPFLASHLHVPEVRRLVKESFLAFLTRNVWQYDYRRHAAGFCGSVAYHYRDLLAEAACEAGVRLGAVVRSPMEGLLAYHDGGYSPVTSCSCMSKARSE